MIKCQHNNVNFIGQFSMIGNYICSDCKVKIDPVVFAILRGMPHVLFREEEKVNLRNYLNNLDSSQKEMLEEFRKRLTFGETVVSCPMRTKEEILEDAIAARKAEWDQDRERRFELREIRKKQILQNFPDAIFDDPYVILAEEKFNIVQLDEHVCLVHESYDKHDAFYYFYNMAGLATTLERVYRRREEDAAWKKKTLWQKIKRVYNCLFKGEF